jgi:hypothetical protein
MRNQSNTRKPVSKGNRCKIRNWSAYNQALKQRGSLEIWIDDEVRRKWYYQGDRQRGGQYQYSDSCIMIAFTVREVYRLPYRQTEGFMKSLIIKLGWGLEVPNYTVINRRRKQLNINIKGKKKRKTGKLFIVIACTGGKVYGEGEWKVRQHGWGKHRTWMKIHLAVDENSKEIESCATTTNSIDDAAVVAPLLDEVQGQVNKLAADGAYDKRKVYRELEKRKIIPVIPPRKGARIEKHGNAKGKPSQRDKNIRAIRKLGRSQWKKKTQYHRRSIVESTMFRYKTIFGDKFTSRSIKQQEIEVKIKCTILNKMTRLGMPITYKVKKAA